MKYIQIKKHGEHEIVFSSCGFQMDKDWVGVPDEVIDGDRIDWYNEDWSKKPLQQLVDEGLKELRKGYKVVDNEEVEMTDIEKFETDCHDFYTKDKYKVDGEKIIALTQKELFENGTLSNEEYINYIKSMRDGILSSMDKYSIMHTEGVITDAQYEKVKAFKDYLRGIPQIKGFPKTFTEFEEFSL